ncbi:MAG: S41 family peptidase [Candidatus Cloacimonas sp.]|nr:S41 family peptidase [Candidatus Cloacimonas sp.]HNQ39660.1 S41 family peptidase [Candidatus Cloacimonas sp.]HNS84516.1 S41 family peptidase [Candidatus Cloacimonas sp.]
MNRPKQKLALISIISIWVLSALLLVVATNAYAQNRPQSTNLYSQVQLFSEVLYKLKQYYVTDLNDEELIKAAIEGMLSSTDPHTSYFTPEEFKEFTTSTKGSFGGLGIQIDKIGNYITVVSPIEGTPAYRMGITAGDKIIKVDDISVVGFSTDEAIKRMRGDVGTKVKITISRPGLPEPIDFEIIRETIKIKSIPYSFKLDNGVGYIRITQFNENTVTELRAALDNLEKQNVKGLIIDLRWNPGGLLDQAVDTVNEFIGKNRLVVETKGRTENKQLYTRFDVKERNYPIIVLVNEASASASEIFAGSLQDWDKGLVMGKNTFGKGSVQQLIPLSNGNGIKITTAYYYIKSGRCIHKMSNDKLLTGKDVSEEDLKKETETNLQQVYYTANNRKVYGGGGIQPDITVESDFLTLFGVELRRKNVFFNFAVDYLVQHNHQFDINTEIDNRIMNEFLAYVSKNDIKYSQADVDSANSFIRTSIKSELVRKVYGDEDAYKITIYQDKQLMEAISLFDRFKTLEQMFAYAASLNEKKEK